VFDKTAFNEYLATGKGLPATSMYDASLFYDTGVDPCMTRRASPYVGDNDSRQTTIDDQHNKETQIFLSELSLL
jgi:hypothetical protein